MEKNKVIKENISNIQETVKILRKFIYTAFISINVVSANSDVLNNELIDIFDIDLRNNDINLHIPEFDRNMDFLSEEEIKNILLEFRNDSVIRFHYKMFDSPDTVYYFNDKYKRVIVDSIHADDYKVHSKKGQKKFQSWKENIALSNGIDPEEIYFSKGKSFHYDFDAVNDELEIARESFVQKGVDPLYVEWIMRIESPNGKKSSAGAVGKLQIMKRTAKKYGLTVNRKRDDRLDIKKASSAMAKFFIDTESQIQGYLDDLNMTCENKIYFMLLVLNAYQTGPLNIQAVLQYMNERGYEKVDKKFIREMWNTEIKHRYKIKNTNRKRKANYGLQSRQYTQVAIAAWLKYREDKERDKIPENSYVNISLPKNEDEYFEALIDSMPFEDSEKEKEDSDKALENQAILDTRRQYKAFLKNHRVGY